MIKPIIDFGWMMTLGLLVSFIVTFFVLPSLLSIFSLENEVNVRETEKSLITSILGTIAKKGNILLLEHTFLLL